MMDSPWEIGYGLAHNDACFQISGTERYSSLNLIVSSSGFCFMKDRISVILASCPCWSYGPHQSFLLMILVFGLGIFVCLYLFMNFVLERTLKTNFPGTSLANCAAVPLASLDSANFFDNLKTLPFHFVWAILPMLWRRKWQPTPEFLLGELHGERSLVGYSPWDCKESDMTERLSLTLTMVPLSILHALAEVLILWENLLPVIESTFL